MNENKSQKRKVKRKMAESRSEKAKHMTVSKNIITQRCYIFSVRVIRSLMDASNIRFHRAIVDQLIRSATSVGANVVEAQASSSRKDFTRFYEIALKSANETKYWLCIFRDTTDFPKEDITKFLKEIDEISKILGASILTLKGKRNKKE